MNSTVEKAGPCRVHLVLEADAGEVDAAIHAAYKRASKAVRIDGFRRGKVPRKVLESRFGAAIHQDAKETLVDRMVHEAEHEAEFRLFGHPDIPWDDISFDAGSDLTVECDADIHPDVRLVPLDSLNVDAEDVQVGEAEVDTALDELGQAHQRPVETDALEEDGLVRVKLTFRCGEDEVRPEAAAHLSPAHPLPGSDEAAYSDAIHNTPLGESFTLPVVFPAEFRPTHFAGEGGEAVVEMEAWERLESPPVEELATALGLADADALRQAVTADIEARKTAAEHRRQEDALLDALSAAAPFDLPERLVDNARESQLRRYRADLEAAGTPPEDLDDRLRDAQQKSQEVAEESLRRWFLIEALAVQEGIRVTETDLENEYRSLGHRHGSTPRAVRDAYRRHRMEGDLAADIREARVRRSLREKAGLTGSPN